MSNTNPTDENRTDSADEDEAGLSGDDTVELRNDERVLRDALSRRIIIKTAAATGMLSGFSGIVTSQAVENTFELEGETGGWQGVSPEEIEGDRNPTLEVVHGEDYEVMWENTDGAAHNFAIENENGDVVFSSDFISSIGETDTVEFTAEDDFQVYLCEPHPDTMTGDFEIVDPDEEVDEEEELEEDEVEEEEVEEDEVEEEEDIPEGEPETVFRLTLEENQWRGLAPEEIEDETNPTLELEDGEIYSITWLLRTERDRHETGHNLVLHDEEGRHLLYTQFLTYEGTSLTLKFTADEEMAYYSDQSQLDAQGDIEVTTSDESNESEDES